MNTDDKLLKRRQDALKNLVHVMMNDGELREGVSVLLDTLDVDAIPGSVSSLESNQFVMGRVSVGRQIQQLLQEVDAEGYILMLQEEIQRTKENV